MLSEWCYFDKALSNDECDALVSYLEANYEYQDSTIGFGENNKVDQEVRNCKIGWINH